MDHTTDAGHESDVGDVGTYDVTEHQVRFIDSESHQRCAKFRKARSQCDYRGADQECRYSKVDPEIGRALSEPVSTGYEHNDTTEEEQIGIVQPRRWE